MRARDVMTTAVLSVSPNTSAAGAARLMRGRRIHHLLVKDGALRAGIVSDRDLGGRLSATATGDRTSQSNRRRPLHHRAPHRPRARFGVW